MGNCQREIKSSLDTSNDCHCNPKCTTDDHATPFRTIILALSPCHKAEKDQNLRLYLRCGIEVLYKIVDAEWNSGNSPKEIRQVVDASVLWRREFLMI